MNKQYYKLHVQKVTSVYIALFCLVNNWLGIAALHYNENCNRDQATTKDGQQCFNTCYPKKGTHAIAKPRTPPPSFG
jgi:hypothetical protein